MINSDLNQSTPATENEVIVGDNQILNQETQMTTDSKTSGNADLETIVGDDTSAQTNYTVTQLEIDKIQITDDRRKIDEESIPDLAASIDLYGLIHPIVVSSDGFLVSGNHRLTAHKVLKKKRINAYIMPFKKDSDECRMVELSENADRVELSKLEKAVASFEMYNCRKKNTKWLSQNKDSFSERNKKLLMTSSAIPEIMTKFDISRSEAYALIDIAGKLVTGAVNYLVAVNLADNMKVVKEFSELNFVQQNSLISQCLPKKEFVEKMKDITKRNKPANDKPIALSRSEKKDKTIEEINQQIEEINSKGFKLDLGLSDGNTYLLENRGQNLIQEFKTLSAVEWYIKGAATILEISPTASIA